MERMERIEKFSQEERKFLYLDFSGFRTCEEFDDLAEQAKLVIANYSECSLYVISNITDVRLNSCTKKVILNFIQANAPYVKYSSVIGIDGIKKMMVEALIKLSKRNNFFFAFSKEQAIELILNKNL